ncbi:MAG TPA: FAD-binding protein [Candidatus Dormibacteraeota bacterium]|nr:FAD-binding protein [Candidatus Dormibacteraeota bacterium]
MVIGDGLAGSAAALEAARLGARVALVSAGPASSERAQGGIAAAMLPEDSPRLHALDTLAAGAGLCDPDAVEMLTSAGPQTVRWLESLGVHFDGGAAREAAHSRPRVLHLGGDQSGHTLMGFVHAALDREPRVTRFRARLHTLVGDGVCEGGIFSGGLTVFAGATVLATGGYAGLYERTTNSRLSNGKGILEAARAGARLADLEFVQFHPTVFAGVHPFLITEALRGAGAYIVDAAGRRFIDELLPRDQVARALATHQGAAYISATHMDPEVLRLGFPNFMRNCRRAGIDPLREPVPIMPAAHYTMGGVATDLDGRASLAGLFAAGEVARTGVHGANRLASNSLLEAAAFGRRAAAAAAGTAPISGSAAGRARVWRRGDLSLEDVRRLLDSAAGVLRTGAGLERALRLLKSGTSSAAADDAADMASMICAAGLARPLSLGAHQMLDETARIAV